MLGQTSEAGGGIILIVSWQGAAQGDQGTSWEHDGAACTWARSEYLEMLNY